MAEADLACVQELMEEPVTAADGFNYERKALALCVSSCIFVLKQLHIHHRFVCALSHDHCVDARARWC